MKAPPPSRPYPGHGEYDLAIKYIDRFVSDPVLKCGTPKSRNGTPVARGGPPLCYPGGFANVYAIDCGVKTYALRVWLHNIGDLAHRYSLVTEYLRKTTLPYFVDLEYTQKGILVQGYKWPILRMEWVSGHTLGNFIAGAISDRAKLRSAANSFLEMVKHLHSNNTAHGDLQAENLIVFQKNGSVEYKLIDYDTLVVPALIGAAISSSGLPSYQHPNRARSTLATSKDDYFSELVIYLTLYALSEHPELWRSFPAKGRDKELLFNAQDFSSSTPSPLFRKLYELDGVVRQLTVVLWNFKRCPGIDLLLPLEKAVEVATASESATTKTAKKGDFVELLKNRLHNKSAAVNGLPLSWLDDSQFRAGPATNTTAKRPPNRSSSTQPQRTSPQNPTTFQEMLDGLKVGSRHATQPKTIPWIPIGVLCAIVAILITAIANSPNRNNNTSTTYYQPSPPPDTSLVSPTPRPPDATSSPVDTPAPATSRLSVASTNSNDNQPRSNQDADSQPVDNFQNGLQQANAGSYSDAVESFKKALATEPNRAATWYNLGWSYWNLKDFDEAIPALEKATVIQPDYEDAWYILALAYHGAGRINDVLHAVVQLRTLDRVKAQNLLRTFDEEYVKRLVAREYPSVTRTDSPLYQEVLSRYTQYRATNPAYFSASDWPFTIVEESQHALHQQ